MSKVCGFDVTVAAKLPAERTVPSSVFWIPALNVGFAFGKSSKCGPLFCAPCQCVVSTESIPSETASMSWVDSALGIYATHLTYHCQRWSVKRVSSRPDLHGRTQQTKLLAILRLRNRIDLFCVLKPLAFRHQPHAWTNISYSPSIKLWDPPSRNFIFLVEMSQAKIIELYCR